ncbi:MAG TPA: hypothetical protein VHD91_01795, partial [Gaiellaceae bacterium]|nr:hypothetical protein [Gaiellaceae bacterium]
MQRFSVFLVVLFAAAVLVGEAAARPPSAKVRAERAHERAVQAEVDRIGANLERTIQEYDGAKLRLARVDRNLQLNEYALRVARSNLRTAQKRLEARLVSLYENGQPGTLDVLAGAQSLSQIVDRLESAKALSSQDAQIGQETLRFQGTVQRREELLKRQRAQRAEAVRQLAAQKRTIENALGRQKRLRASIHRTIQQTLAAEAAAARRAAEAARERLQREIAAREAADQQAAVSPAPQPGLVSSPAAVANTGGGHAEAAQIAL